MQTDIFIARHGQTEFNRTERIQGRGVDESLNAMGRRQAGAIAACLADKEIQHIFSSSLKRSVETAEIIARDLNVPLNAYKELDEMDFGVIEGQPIKEIKHELKQLQNHWRNGHTDFALKHAESPEGVQARVFRRLHIVIDEHPGQNLLFVLHGRLIRIILSHWLDKGLANMHHIEHQNGALNHLRVNDDETVEPVYLNKTEHLAEPGD